MEINEQRAANFEKLHAKNLNDKLDKKGELNYLSWAWAWAEFKKVYPSANYSVRVNQNTNLPYFADETGIMVYTSVTADGLEYSMWLPVMDGANKAMKLQPYKYKVFNRKKNAEEERTVEAASMMDINKAVMRCLVKNLAMFGLGLYVYEKEDLPEPPEDMVAAEIEAAIMNASNKETLLNVFYQNAKFINTHPDFKAKFSARRAELEQNK